jgi:hypothetical protein
VSQAGFVHRGFFYEGQNLAYKPSNLDYQAVKMSFYPPVFNYLPKQPPRALLEGRFYRQNVNKFFYIPYLRYLFSITQYIAVLNSISFLPLSDEVKAGNQPGGQNYCTKNNLIYKKNPRCWPQGQISLPILGPNNQKRRNFFPLVPGRKPIFSGRLPQAGGTAPGP